MNAFYGILGGHGRRVRRISPAPFQLSVLGFTSPVVSSTNFVLRSRIPSAGHTVAGAALLGTFLTSIVGVFFYSVLPANGGFSSPDWALGFLFGLGGFAGMYLGARLQKYVPQKFIKLILGIMIVSVAFKYIVQFF